MVGIQITTRNFPAAMANSTQQAVPVPNVQLLPQGSLSIRSYGKVCKELNQLPCAVKLLHPVLFQFEQECEFLSEIRPPHIVQYLGVARA